MLIEERLRGGSFNEGFELLGVGGHQDPVKLGDVLDTTGTRLLDYGAEERASVGAPTALGPFVVRNERTGELIDVVVIFNLAVQIPFGRSGLEGIQDHITPPLVIEAPEIAAVRISDDGAVASLERAREHFANRGALAGPGRADELEVFGLVCGGYPHSGESE